MDPALISWRTCVSLNLRYTQARQDPRECFLRSIPQQTFANTPLTVPDDVQ